MVECRFSRLEQFRGPATRINTYAVGYHAGLIDEEDRALLCLRVA